MLRNWKFWLSLAISAVALYLALRGVRFDEFFEALARAELVWLIPAAVAFGLTLALRAWRWSALMGGTPFNTTFHAMNIGYMLNMSLPARVGEIGRAYVMGERSSVSMARSLSSIVIERLIDLITVIALFAVMSQFIPVPQVFSAAALALGAVTVAAVAALALAVWQSDRAERIVRAIVADRLHRDAEPWLRRLRDLIAGFRVYREPRVFWLSLALTAALWLTSAGVAFAFLRAFTPDARPDAAGFVMVVANLGGAVPSAPGGLGVVQLFAQQSLVIPFKINESLAIAFAFVWSLTQQLALIVLGVIGLWRIGMSFSQTAGAAQRAPEPPAAAGR